MYGENVLKCSQEGQGLNLSNYFTSFFMWCVLQIVQIMMSKVRVGPHLGRLCIKINLKIFFSLSVENHKPNFVKVICKYLPVT